jgi:hypothetical protein
MTSSFTFVTAFAHLKAPAAVESKHSNLLLGMGLCQHPARSATGNNQQQLAKMCRNVNTINCQQETRR